MSSLGNDIGETVMGTLFGGCLGIFLFLATLAGMGIEWLATRPRALPVVGMGQPIGDLNIDPRVSRSQQVDEAFRARLHEDMGGNKWLGQR